jgi:D-beta-D-heptose 7-phosphate kinase / D-beta-D-heptose 1-phosphate adenosyltransferase
MDNYKARKLLKEIKSSTPKILVIGDIMLDHYIKGSVKRISPEAPVPILNFRSENSILGGAGNVLCNLYNLGAELVVATVIGNDKTGLEVLQKIESLNSPINSVYISDEVTTTKKTRFVDSRTQLLRLDNDSKGVSGFPLEFLEKKIFKNIASFDCIILSDYGKGVGSKITTTKIIEVANKNNIAVLIDPKGKSWDKYSKATGVTPNIKEVEDKFNIKLKTNEDFEKIGNKIIKNFNLEFCLITRGSDGMTYIDSRRKIHQKVEKKEVYDVSGAGDTVIACLAASMSSNLTIEDSIELSSFVSSEVVSHHGTTPFRHDMLIGHE